MNDPFDNGGHRLARHTWFGLFELVGFEIVLFQKVVEIGAIFARQFGGLADIAFGHGQDLHQIVALEGIPRIFERSQVRRSSPTDVPWHPVLTRSVAAILP